MSLQEELPLSTSQVLQVESAKVIKRVKKCSFENYGKLCTVNLGSDSSILRESTARSLSLKFKDRQILLSALFHLIVVPVAH